MTAAPSKMHERYERRMSQAFESLAETAYREISESDMDELEGLFTSLGFLNEGIIKAPPRRPAP